MTPPVPEGLRLVSAFGDRRIVAPSAPRRAFGVPPGGPFDRLGAALANALIGRPDAAPILEIALGPVVFEALEPVVLAVVGGPDGTFPLQKGERLEILPVGARAYVATRLCSLLIGRGVGKLADPPRNDDQPLRILSGPQANQLAPLRGEYRVGLASNRVGVRLEGEAAPHALSLPSEPAVPGAIQIPPNGQPIVLGPDGPTLGGYPKVAVVIGADLDRVGRLRPGDEVRFQEISLEAAREAAQQARRERERRTSELRVWALGGEKGLRPRESKAL